MGDTLFCIKVPPTPGVCYRYITIFQLLRNLIDCKFKQMKNRFLEGVLVGVELCLFEAVSTKKSAGNGFVGSSEARGC